MRKGISLSALGAGRSFTGRQDREFQKDEDGGPAVKHARMCACDSNSEFCRIHVGTRVSVCVHVHGDYM